MVPWIRPGGREHVGVRGAGEEAEWRLQHAQHVEMALLSQQANMDAIGQAVAAVGQDVQPGSVPDASFLVAAAEGVLFEGLASLLRQVNPLLACTSSPQQAPPSPSPRQDPCLSPLRGAVSSAPFDCCNNCCGSPRITCFHYRKPDFCHSCLLLLCAATIIAT